MALEKVNEETAPLRNAFRRRKQLEKDLEHITQEMYRRNRELIDTNRILSLLRTIDSLVLESTNNLQVLCEQVSRAIVGNSDYLFIALFVRMPHREQLELLSYDVAADFASPKLLADYHSMSKIYLDASSIPWLSSDERALAIDVARLGNQTISTYLHCSETRVSSLRHTLPVNLVYCVKLMARGKLVGVMAAGLPTTIESVQNRDEMFLQRLSEAVGVAVDSKLLFQENQHVLEQLRRTNQKLLALDQAKDEFISMASHQLRTPLTSVKGYVSMVLDGDAGKLNTMQQKLLHQAFNSSQRMVYLIADLLNVSRLKTGKFIIEAQATNLADVIDGEISQLAETAKSRGVELAYDKPNNFPLFMLDETKLRQVIMNFIDNAIYYTPSGGHIQVQLQDMGQSIEFRVVDDGLGVPRAEQHHLFTKFYRAGNARKARPDGTGLGLFMAKKVIVAQGGALIFKSKEGKGSTFGFSFAKAKLQTPFGK